MMTSNLYISEEFAFRKWYVYNLTSVNAQWSLKLGIEYCKSNNVFTTTPMMKECLNCLFFFECCIMILD